MKYCVLLCGLLLMQAVGLSAKERARLQADDVNISRSGDSVHVSFRLKVERLAKDYILRVTPLLYGKDGQQTVLPPLEYGSRTAKKSGSLPLHTTRREKRLPIPSSFPTGNG